MKLAHYDLEMVIDWRENNVPILVIESPRRFRTLVAELIAQCDGVEGRFVLSEDWQPISISKTCELISEPLSIDINDRRISAALAKWLKTEIVSERLYVATMEIKRRIEEWIYDLSEQSEEPLCWSDEPDWSQIFKAFDLRFDEEYCDLPEKILRRIRIGQTFLHKDCYVFINLKHYLERNELHALYQAAFYRKARLLLIENNCPEIDKTYETAWIIDRDDCEIFPDEV